MPTVYKTPGVKIEEQPAVGPIEAVGTSTAAFVGPALSGPMREPTKITNWTQFVDKFGLDVRVNGRVEPSPYSAFPRRLYMPYAVRGFFDNGGTSCYVVRVGTAVHAYLELEDRADQAETAPPVLTPTPTPTPTPAPPGPAPGIALRIEAKKEGVAGNNITVQVEDDSLQQETKVASAQTNIRSAQKGSTQATVDNASKFRPGDEVELKAGTSPAPTPTPTPTPTPAPPSQETATIERIRVIKADGTPDHYILVFRSPLGADYSGGTVKIPDLKPGDDRFRVLDTRGIERGSVIRLAKDEGAMEDAEVVHVVRLPAEGDARPGFLILKDGLDYSYGGATKVTVQSLEFKLTICDASGTKEEFEGRSMHPDHSNYYGLINSRLVEVQTPREPSMAPPPRNRPRVIPATKLDGGQEDDLLALEPTHFFDGIDELEKVDDVNILCAPDAVGDPDPDERPSIQRAVQAAMIAHCQKMFDRVAILDPLPGQEPSEEGILSQRNQLPGTPRGFGALYYPQIRIQEQDPLGRGQILVPPSGHIAGIYARSDATRGVHKAPANEGVRMALALERELTDAEQGELNVQGVNVLRVFPGLGPTVWGARTLSTETAWRYVSTRRLFLMVEESIQEGTRWAVFEPNNEALWATIKRNVTAFLSGVWRDGALFGTTPEEAFYVKVDEELNPPEVRALGQVIIEVGMVPVFPAEFVVFRIAQLPGGAEVSES